MIQIYVANISRFLGGCTNEGAWVSLPATSDTLSKLLDSIGVNAASEYFIPASESTIDGLSSVIKEHLSLGEVNDLARALTLLDKYELNKVEAILEYESPSLPTLMAILDDLDVYDFYPGIHSDIELGHHFVDELDCLEVPDYLKYYIDYEAYGRDIRLECGGSYVSGGFIYSI